MFLKDTGINCFSLFQRRALPVETLFYVSQKNQSKLHKGNKDVPLFLWKIDSQTYLYVPWSVNNR